MSYIITPSLLGLVQIAIILILAPLFRIEYKEIKDEIGRFLKGSNNPPIPEEP